MKFQTMGNNKNPVILFFHAMGVTGESSYRVADYLKDKYFCVMPTSTVYCHNQSYQRKQDEIRQIEEYLQKQGIEKITLVVASSIGADLGLTFLSQTKIPIEHTFFDGGQFAQISRLTRKIMVPFLYLAIKSLYWSKGATLSKFMWCSEESIKPYFIKAGKNLRYKNLYRQMMDSLEDKEFPKLSQEVQRTIFFEFGSVEEHYKYRDAVKKAYPHSHFPLFQDENHMQMQILDPKCFAKMMDSIICTGKLTEIVS